MGASAADKTNVDTTWKKAYADWDSKYGVEFYTRMFTNQPAIRSKFTDPDLKVQSTKFGVMVNRWVAGLSDAGTFKSSMGEFCTKHTAMGITDMSLFTVALKELSDFLAEKLKMSAAEKASWGVVADDILKAMNDTF